MWQMGWGSPGEGLPSQRVRAQRGLPRIGGIQALHPPGAPSQVMGGMVLGEEQSAGLFGSHREAREGAVPSPSFVPLPTLLGRDHGKSQFREGQTLCLRSDPQAWCGSPGRILRD